MYPLEVDLLTMTPINCTYDSFSIRVKSPVGTYTIFFMEDRVTHTLKGIDIHCGKAGSELRAWNSTMSLMLTELLETGKISIKDILVYFSSQRSDKVVRDDNTLIEITSGPEAIAFACQKYLTEKAVEFYTSTSHNPLRIHGQSDRQVSYIPRDVKEFYAEFIPGLRGY
jgi:hypothetical protein